MIRLDTPIAVIDTETLGLDPLAPVWDFAAVRIDRDGHEIARESFLIDHNRGHWLDQMPEQFADDYRARYRPADALSAYQAAARIKSVTDGAVIAGSNPSFDMQRLETMLRREGFTPGWHYHGIDIPSMVVGYKSAISLLSPRVPRYPWKSDQLSDAIGVNPAQYERHTAYGDVEWCLAQWRHMTGQGSADA